MAIDRTSKVAFAEPHPRTKRVVAAVFLRRLLDKLPYKVHKRLTYNYIPFTPQAHQLLPDGHHFDRIRREYGVEHRLTNPAHLWTNGPVERRNRTIKEATVQRFHYQTRQEFNEHLRAFLLAQNHPKQLKTLPPPTNSSVPSGKTTPLPLSKTWPSSPCDYTTSVAPAPNAPATARSVWGRGHPIGQTGLRSALAFAAKQSLQPGCPLLLE